MVTIDKTRFEKDYGETLSDADWQRVDGLIRRATRELVLLVGPLDGHDDDLVIDTLIDAVREDAANPGRFQSESDDSYSYRRFEMPDGTRGRFWWPLNLLELFGIKVESSGRVRVIRTRPSLPGWVGL